MNKCYFCCYSTKTTYLKSRLDFRQLFSKNCEFWENSGEEIKNYISGNSYKMGNDFRIFIVLKLERSNRTSQMY